MLNCIHTFRESCFGVLEQLSKSVTVFQHSTGSLHKNFNNLSNLLGVIDVELYFSKKKLSPLFCVNFGGLNIKYKYSIFLIFGTNNNWLSKTYTIIQSPIRKNKVFYPFFSFAFYTFCNIFTQSEQVTRVFIFFHTNNDPIHRQPVLFV